MANFSGRPFDIRRNRQNDKKVKLLQILSLKPSNRSEGQVYEAVKLLEDNSFLMRYAGTNQLRILVKNMRIHHYDKLETIATEGQPGQIFFLVLSGRLGVSKFESETLLHELTIGSSYGESCLLNSDPYPSTVTALEKSTLIILDKSVYDSTIKSVQSQQMHAAYIFFKGLPLLYSASESLINYFSQVAYIRCFVPNSYIIRQDEFTSGVYIISEGNVLIKRAVLVEGTSVNIVLDELGAGDIFCDSSFFNKNPMHHSVLCTMPLTCYYLHKDDLSRLEGSLLLEFRRACKPYPDDKMLLAMYKEKKDWIGFKSEMIRTVNVEKELRKSFDMRLRKPNLEFKKELLFMPRISSSRGSSRRGRTAQGRKRTLSIL